MSKKKKHWVKNPDTGDIEPCEVCGGTLTKEKCREMVETYHEGYFGKNEYGI